MSTQTSPQDVVDEKKVLDPAADDVGAELGLIQSTRIVSNATVILSPTPTKDPMDPLNVSIYRDPSPWPSYLVNFELLRRIVLIGCVAVVQVAEACYNLNCLHVLLSIHVSNNSPEPGLHSSTRAIRCNIHGSELDIRNPITRSELFS